MSEAGQKGPMHPETDAAIRAFLNARRPKLEPPTPRDQKVIHLPWKTLLEIQERSGDEGIDLVGWAQLPPAAEPNPLNIHVGTKAEVTEDHPEQIEVLKAEMNTASIDIQKICKYVGIVKRGMINETHNPHLGLTIFNGAKNLLSEHLNHLRRFLNKAEAIVPSAVDFIGSHDQHPNSLIQRFIDEYLNPAVEAIATIHAIHAQAKIFEGKLAVKTKVLPIIAPSSGSSY